MNIIPNSELETAYQNAEDNFYRERNTTYDGYSEAKKLLIYVSKSSEYPQYRNRRIALQCYRCIYDKLTPAREWPPFVLEEYIPELITTKDGRLTDNEKKELLHILVEVLDYPSEKKITLNDFENVIALVDMYLGSATNNPCHVSVDFEFAGEILTHIEMAVDMQLFYQNFSLKEKMILVDRVSLLLYRQKLLYQKLGLTKKEENIQYHIDELKKHYNDIKDIE